MSGEAPKGAVDRLLDAIMDDDGIAAGTREAPVSIRPEQAREVLRDVYAGHEQADAHLPAASSKLGKTIACKAGCSYCCESLILVSVPEADLVAEELARPGREALRERFVAGAKAWDERAGARAREAARLWRERSEPEYRSRLLDHALDRVMCPLNQDGQCTVYEARPLPCRQSWAVTPPEQCLPSRDPKAKPAEMITFDEREAFIATARRVTAGLQSALGEGVDRRPLALAVLERLGEADDDS